jgi:predicted permease
MRRRERMMEDLDQDIREHIESETQDNIDSGMPPEEARYAATRKFGNVTLVKEETREVWTVRWLEELVQDVRFGLRMLRKSPGFTIVAVLTFALGIGANTAIFSLVNGVLLRPLPYPHPEQVVAIYDVQPNYGNAPMSYPEYTDWRDKSQVFQMVAASHGGSFVLSGLGDPEQVRILCVSSSYLPLFGIQPVIGRNIWPEEEPFLGHPAAMITYSFWRNRLAGDANVLNRTLTLDGTVFPIVGVMPQNYQPLSRGDILIGLWLNDKTMSQRGLHFMDVYGRLRPGLSSAQAEKELLPLAERLKKDRSTTNGIAVADLKDELTRDSNAPLILMFGAVGFILLIGCVNVANLQLARAAGRHREMALRIALGGGRWRIIRQLITESTLLSVLGAALGLLVGRWTIAGLVDVLGPRLPRAGEIAMNSTVLLFTLAVAVAVGILFGLAPARSLLRTSLAASPGEGRRSGTGSGGRQRSGLIVVEVALALVLMVGAGLVLRSFSRLLDVPKGFAADHVLTFDVYLSAVKYHEPEKETAFFTELRTKLAALPGVESVGLISDVPLSRSGTSGTTLIDGKSFPPDSQPYADKRITSPGYFTALRIPFLRGHDFSDRDVKDSPPVAIINDAFAKKYFSNEDPIGKHLQFGWGIDGSQEIIGVVGNTKQDALSGRDHRAVYVSYTQRPDAYFSSSCGRKTTLTQ